MLRNLALTVAAHWRVGLIIFAAALVWIAHFDRWTLASWQIPTDYYVDAHETLARMKAASEGDIWPLRPQVIERLGAPFGAHWNGYPTPDKPIMLGLGVLVRAIGLYAAANVGFMLAAITAAIAFYIAARWLRCRWEWAAAGSLLFAYTYHTFHRGLSHYSLVLTWTVPLGLLAVWLVAGSRRIEWSKPGSVACIVSAIALGASNPYNLYFWLQLMGWAVVFQAFGGGRRPNLEIGLVSMATAVAVFFVVHAEVWVHADDTGGLPLLARNYGGTEVYALKPVEMFIPPSFHPWEWLAFFGNRYTRWSEWRGEVFLPYLGLAGIAGLIWLAIATIRNLIARRPLPGQSLSLGWILLFASIGGITNILAFFMGLQIFRATNRAAIFISAIVLFFLMVRLSRLSVRWPRWLSIGAAVVLTAIGVSEQIPRLDSPEELREIERRVKADEQFGRELEAALPDGAMVFQLPVLGFPEVATPYQLNDYEHFRPFLSTHDLRFSYGAPKTRARSRWQRDLAQAPAGELVARLEEHGFSALYINRKGFADRAESLLHELTRLGYTQRIETVNGNQIAVMLRPASDPTLPLARVLTIGRGWYIQPDAGVRWTHKEGALSYFNPHPQPIAVELTLTLQAVTPREVLLARDDDVVRRMVIGTTPERFELAHFEMLPGINRFTLRSESPATRLGQGPNQLRSFGLKASSVQRSAAEGSNADRSVAAQHE